MWYTTFLPFFPFTLFKLVPMISKSNASDDLEDESSLVTAAPAPHAPGVRFTGFTLGITFFGCSFGKLGNRLSSTGLLGVVDLGTGYDGEEDWGDVDEPTAAGREG